MITIIRKAHRRTTKKGKVIIPIILLVILSIPIGIWMQKIQVAAEELRNDPAFRIVKSCDEPKMRIFRDHIVKDHTIVPCD